MKTWHDYLQEFVMERVIEFEEQVLPKNREYKALQEKADLLFRRILEYLETKDLGFDYETAQSSEMNLRSRLIYRQGLLDGIRFTQWFDRLRAGAPCKEEKLNHKRGRR